MSAVPIPEDRCTLQLVAGCWRDAAGRDCVARDEPCPDGFCPATASAYDARRPARDAEYVAAVERLTEITYRCAREVGAGRALRADANERIRAASRVETRYSTPECPQFVLTQAEVDEIIVEQWQRGDRDGRREVTS